MSRAGRSRVPGPPRIFPRLKRTGSRLSPATPTYSDPNGHRLRRGGRGEARSEYPQRPPTCLDEEQEQQNEEEIPGAASASHRGGCAGTGALFHVPALARVPGARQSRAPRAASAKPRPLLPAPSPCAAATPLLPLSFNIQAAKSHTKPTDTSKLTTEHFIALQREEIQLHPQNTEASFPKQETLTSHLFNPTHREEPPQ